MGSLKNPAYLVRITSPELPPTVVQYTGHVSPRDRNTDLSIVINYIY